MEQYQIKFQLLNLIVPFLLSFLISILCSFLVLKFGYKIAMIDTPNKRSSHNKPTPRGGGIGIWIAYAIIGFFTIQDNLFVLITSSIGLLGLLEDCYVFSYKLRLIIQLVLATLLTYFFGPPLSSFSVGMLFLFWVVFITGTVNFYNFMDGINGIAGLAGIVGFCLIAFFSYFIAHNSDIAFISIALSFACLGFLSFNFPNAKIFMGDVGSTFLGFVFASFLLKLSININIFLCLVMFLYTFYADALVTIFYRWRKGENLMEAHRSHLYQYMTNELGLPHWKVSSIYTTVQLITGILSIITFKNGLIWQFIFLIVCGITFLAAYNNIKKVKPPFVAPNLQK